MTEKKDHLTVFGGNGYGGGAVWPTTEADFLKLLRNLIDCNFNAVMFDKAALHDNYPAFIDLVKDAGLHWLSDLSDYVQKDGYQWGTNTRDAVEETKDAAWGFQIWLQLAKKETVTKINKISKEIQSAAPGKPTMAAMNPDFGGRTNAMHLAEAVDYIGIWTSVGHKHDATAAGHWRRALSSASAAKERHFFFKATFRENQPDFLNDIGEYFVTASIEHDPDYFVGPFWTTYRDEQVFRYAYDEVPGPAAEKIRSINSLLLQSSTAFSVNSFGDVYSLFAQGRGVKYSPEAKFAKDIGVGADGTVWIIGNEERPGGYAPMWLKDLVSKSWVTLRGNAAAVRLAVAPDGIAYTVNSGGKVWTLLQAGGGDLLSPEGEEFAKDIGVGADGTVWVISTEERPGGYAPKWLKDAKTQSWGTAGGTAAGVRIAVGQDGKAYTVDSKGAVWTFGQDGKAEPVGNQGENFAQDIGVGRAGAVWVVTTEKKPSNLGGYRPAWLNKENEWVVLRKNQAVTEIAVQ